MALNLWLVAAGLAAETQATRGAPGQNLTLAHAGVTDYVIVESGTSIGSEGTAAGELAKYLKKVTGADFKRVREAPELKVAKGIYVGWTGFAARQGIVASGLAPEQWSVTTVGDSLVITGGRPRGTLDGVYEFLEESIGVHVLDPLTEIIPATAELIIPAPQRSGKPAFLVHDVYCPYDHFSPENPNLCRFFNDFNRNIGYNKTGSPGGCHTFGYYINPKEYGAAHPEYFSMNEKGARMTDAKGTRSQWFSLCLSNPDVRKIIIAKLRGYIESDRQKMKGSVTPPPIIYSIDQNDCIEHECLCPKCKAIMAREGGAESGLILDFINEIADDIRKDYPDILIQTFAYNHTLKIPKTIRPRDNVMIRWCDRYSVSEFFRPLTSDYNREMRDLLEPWCRISRNMAVWDYWRMFRSHAPGFYAPFANISCLQPDLQYFQKNGVKSLFAQSEDFYYGIDDHQADDLQSFNPLRVWLGLKLAQDPQRDVQPLLDTFFSGYYGPAAGKMRGFLAYLERRQNACPQKLITLDRDDYYKAYLDLEFFTTARQMLAEAEAACGTDAAVYGRVARERIPVDSALLHLEPSLRKKFCAGGEPFPFDRGEVLAGYASAWKAYMATFMTEKAREKAAPFVEKRLDYLRAMPMITAESIHQIALPVAEGEIRIDGVPDEAAWAGATRIFLTPYQKMQELKVKTEVRTLWSKEKLYLAFECFDDKARAMKFEQRTPDDPNIWQDSSVEIFLNPSGDRQTYYHWIVNPAGVQTDLAVKTLEGQEDCDRSWNSGAEVAVKINDHSWVVEMAIPFKSMQYEPKDGTALVANFCRSRYLMADAKATQLQSWSPLLIRGFADVAKYGTLTMAGKGQDVPFTSFEGPQDTPSFNPTRACVAAFSHEQASDGKTSLRIEFTQSDDDFGGVTVKTGELSDWSGFTTFKADLFVVGSQTLGTTLRLEADQSSYTTQQLKPGWNRGVTLSQLTAAAKTIDLTRVKNFLFYVSKAPTTRVVFLDNLRLVR